jgi:tol-pal system protein YbgF
MVLRSVHGFRLASARIAAAAILCVAAWTDGVAAQQAQAPPPTAKPAKAAPKPEGQPKAAAKPEGEAGLRQRVENLEEQLVDMQVVIGTLESFAKSGGASSASQTYRAGASAPDAPSLDTGRVVGLENQVKSLTTQVQQLSEQVRAMGGQPRRSEAPAAASAPVASNFGTATVSTEKPDAIGGLLSGPSDSAAATTAIAAASAPGEGGNPRQLYETAYGYLLQQDYGAAEVAFDDFLKRFPNDNLSGNAQFWLGESFFVRGQFKSAAAAFLKGYQTYGKSTKAPDSLLKLAMSMSRMGQKDAACSSFNELNTRFPAASTDVKSRATAEKQRSGCL